MTVTIRGWTKNGNWRDLFVLDERMMVKDEKGVWGLEGVAFFPARFPEIVKFEVFLKP